MDNNCRYKKLSLTATFNATNICSKPVSLTSSRCFFTLFTEHFILHFTFEMDPNFKVESAKNCHFGVMIGFFSHFRIYSFIKKAKFCFRL